MAAAAAVKDVPLSDRLSVIKANQDYINKMISEVSGMKVLLLDKETVCIFGIIFVSHFYCRHLSLVLFTHIRICCKRMSS